MSVSTIRISNINKNRLDKYKKKSGSYEGGITSMMDYFEVTGIDPSETLFNPSSIIKNSSERVVKILKNIENKKINHLIKVSEQILYKMDNIKSDNKEDLPEPKNEDTLSIEESEELASMVINLKAELEQKNIEIHKLNKRIVEVSEQTTSNESPETEALLEDIKIRFKKLDESGKKGTGFNNKEYLIPFAVWIHAKNSILNLINNR